MFIVSARGVPKAVVVKTGGYINAVWGILTLRGIMPQYYMFGGC